MSKKEIMIFNKIRANSGLSKEDVVRMMNDDLSRVPTLASLRELESRGLIVARRSKTNRQTYKLSVNDENITAALLRELEELKENFSRLINKLCTLLQDNGYPKSKSEVRQGKKVRSFIIPAKILYPFTILFDITIALSHRMLFTWSLKVSNIDTLDEAFLLVFSTINDIRKEMVEKLRPYFPIDSIIFRDESREKPVERAVAYPEFVELYNVALLEPLLQTLKGNVIPGVENEQRSISDYLKRIISFDSFLEGHT